MGPQIKVGKRLAKTHSESGATMTESPTPAPGVPETPPTGEQAAEPLRAGCAPRFQSRLQERRGGMLGEWPNVSVLLFSHPNNRGSKGMHLTASLGRLR